MPARFVLTALLAAAFAAVHAPTVFGDQKFSAAEINAADQFVCVWKVGAANDAVPMLQKAQLEIIFRPPNERFAACTGKLTPEKLKELTAPGSPIEFIEPDVKLTLGKEEEPVGLREVTPEVLNAYEHAGRMVCVWKKADGKRERIKDLIKEVGLEIEFEPPNEPFIQCKWNPPLQKSTLEGLMKSPDLDYIEPDITLLAENATQGRVIEFASGTPVTVTANGRLLTTPDDPDINKCWGLKSINAPTAWTCVNSTSVIVATIDSGIDYEHPDLKANVWTNTGEIPGNNIDDDKNGHIDDFYGQNYTVLKNGAPTGDPMDGLGHGTHVAGTIGAVGNNKQGIAGVNWRVQIMALKVFSDDGKAPYGSALRTAIGYAMRNKAKVINMSLSWGSDSQLLAQRFDEAEKAGILMVCSAGNLNPMDDPKTVDNDAIPQFPASFPNDNILSVANITEQEQLSNRSHFGAKSVDLGAPGTDVYSTYPVSKGSYNSLSGTSMASPHVAGAAALIWGQKSNAASDYKAIRKLVLDNVRATPTLSGKSVTGGTLDIGFLCKTTAPPPGQKPPVVRCPPPRCWVPCPPRRHLFYRLICAIRSRLGR